ncbi:MAG: hypothetical protein IK144_08400 [Bacteroidaceae bacterium]|nr:hypothetical protein [Bacteroidaceae bacterium]
MKTNYHNTEELEAKLISRFGTERPFSVPEGYFEGLTGRVMSRIQQRRRRRLVWRWAAAAVLIGCVATGGMLFEYKQQADLQTAENIQYIEDALDYSMIDNMSIASYLTEAE